jgi:transcription initiation factor TFIIH subunit 4
MEYCVAIRSLPPLAKQYVMRLLYVENAVPVKSLQEWAQPDALSKHQVAIDRLEQLRVILAERLDYLNSGSCFPVTTLFVLTVFLSS